jgi:hypothetical protein
MIRIMLLPGVREGPELVLGMMNRWLRSDARAVSHDCLRWGTFAIPLPSPQGLCNVIPGSKYPCSAIPKPDCSLYLTITCVSIRDVHLDRLS